MFINKHLDMFIINKVTNSKIQLQLQGRCLKQVNDHCLKQVNRQLQLARIVGRIRSLSLVCFLCEICYLTNKHMYFV